MPAVHNVPTVRAGDLCKRFGRESSSTVALDRVSLDVERGEWVAVTGPSGCGKSTLLNVLGGLEAPDSGEVSIDGEPITGRSETARARLRRRLVAYVFQQYNLIPDLDARTNVELPLLLRGTSRRSARSRSVAALESLGMEDRLGAYPDELSGGQQQRVAVARALASAPQVILADEPTGALDSQSAQLVIDAFQRARQGGQTIVMVTHDPTVADAADRIVAMRDGRVEQEPSLLAEARR